MTTTASLSDLELDERGLRLQMNAAAQANDDDGWRFYAAILNDCLLDQGKEEEANTIQKRLLRETPPQRPSRWPSVASLKGLSPHQSSVLASTLIQPVCALVGGPGVGKSTAIAAIVQALLATSRVYPSDIALVAPTGKAAVRMTGAIRSAFERDHLNFPINLTARTIHQTLEIGRNGHDGEGWGFQRNERRRLHQRFIIGDELSMLDVSLGGSLYSALATGAHFLMVGDPDQLPPVGHGAPFRDLIAAGIPCGRLVEIHRNAGKIVEVCKAIREEQDFTIERYGETTDNLRHIEASSPGAAIEGLRRVLDNQSGSYDLINDAQIICALNKGGVGRDTLNSTLQRILNPRVKGYSLKPGQMIQGDKVICLKNGWHSTVDEGQVYVANGEIGIVDVADRGRFTMTFAAPRRTIQVYRGNVSTQEAEDSNGGADVKADGPAANFTIGYSITCHKAQGSEWPLTIIFIDDSYMARQICSREWAITALSRAKGLCVTVGKIEVLKSMCQRLSTHRRKTFLTERFIRRRP